MKTLTKQQKENWLYALRSGEYKQGKGYLAQIHKQDAPTYCCLGVYAHACAGASAYHILSDEGFLDNITIKGIDIAEILLTGEEQEGFSSERAISEQPNVAYKLAAMNDNGYDFTEIADWIEKNIPTND